MDAFYVSVELQRRPELGASRWWWPAAGRAPSSPRPATRRGSSGSSRPRRPRARGGCARTRSSCRPTSSSTARARATVMAVLREHVERVEVVGLDEAYLDLSRLRAAEGRRAARARRRCASAPGLCCSIGIGPSKLVAKVASDAEKPDGFVVLTREQACERFAGSPPGLIPGIGPKTAERLAERGIDTLGQLAPRRTTRSRSGSARAWARTSAGSPASRTSARSRRSAGREVGVARDHLRPRPPRASTRSSRCSCGSAERALRDALGRRSARGPHDRHQGAPRRLLDPHPCAHACRAHERPRRGAPTSRSSYCASSTRRGPCGCSASGWPGWTRSRRSPAGPGDDQMALVAS